MKENEMFPKIKKHFSDEELNHMGKELDAAKKAFRGESRT